MPSSQGREELERIRELTSLAEKLFRYKFHLSYVYSFFTFGSLFGGGLLVLWGTGLIVNLVALIAGIVAFALTGVVVLNWVFIDTFRKVEAPRLEGLYWAVSFSVPFVVLYGLWFALSLPEVLLTSGFLWYLALGIAMMLVAVFVESWYVAAGMISARPLLLAGSIILLTAPLLPLVELAVFPFRGNLLGIGFMLLSYFVAASFVLIRAERSFRQHAA